MKKTSTSTAPKQQSSTQSITERPSSNFSTRTKNRNGTRKEGQKQTKGDIDDQDDTDGEHSQPMKDEISNNLRIDSVEHVFQILFQSLQPESSSLENFLSTLLFPPEMKEEGGDEINQNQAMQQYISLIYILSQSSRILFQFMEKSAALYQRQTQDSKQEDNGDQMCSSSLLSGLTELFVLSYDQDEYQEKGTHRSQMIPVDVNTIWEQVDLQNNAFMDWMTKSIRQLVRMVKMNHTKREHQVTHDDYGRDTNTIRLVYLPDLVEEEEHKKQTDRNISSQEEDDEGNEEEEEEDNDIYRMRSRMERALADMEEDRLIEAESDTGVDEEEANAFDRNDIIEKGRNTRGGNGTTNNPSKKKNEEDIVFTIDPAAEVLNDGFFDLHELESFADEEEEMLPDQDNEYLDDIVDQSKQNDTDASEKKNGALHHISGRNFRKLEVEEEDDDGHDRYKEAKDANTSRRRRYRDDEDIQALLKLYKGDDDDNSSHTDDAADLTAEIFFGPPSKYYGKMKNGSKQKAKIKAVPMKSTIKSKRDNDGDLSDDGESWNDYDFVSTGQDWKEDRVGETESRSDYEDEELDEEESADDDQTSHENDIEERNNKLHVKASIQESKHISHSKKLLEQTQRLEEELLAEKPWKMIGEAKGSDRPVESLLEVTPEFEFASKMAPIITEEHTISIEDMIKKRILAEDWDDVVPRELPDIGLYQRKGEVPEVSQEKSKLSLGELYEREYLKKATGYDAAAAEKQTEEDKIKSEIRMIFANVCSKLDALSNYHFAPRPIADEAEVKAITTPAIAMEEVIPLHVSDARISAPEEIYEAKKGRDSILRGESELDQAERKRLRQAKKTARRKARQAKLADEKLISRLQPGLGLNNPYEKRKLREELQMARASGKVKSGVLDSSANYQSSTKFFKKMQKEVEDAVHDDDAVVSSGYTAKKRKRFMNGSNTVDSENVQTKKSSSLKL